MWKTVSHDTVGVSNETKGLQREITQKMPCRTQGILESGYGSGARMNALLGMSRSSEAETSGRNRLKLKMCLGVAQ